MTNTAMLVLFTLAPCPIAQDWPQFRGPDGQGHSTVKSLPLKWSNSSANIKWKVPIKGLGWSSPVTAEGRIWLTTATKSGTSLRAICLDEKTGKEIHNVEVFRRLVAGRIHKKNSHASPTPILDGDRVYVHFGTYGTACLSSKGDVLWKRTLRYKHAHGPGGSPALHEDVLVISCDGTDVQFVVGLDPKTGKTLWKTPRIDNDSSKEFAFSTPLVIDVKKRTQVVSAGAGAVSSYDLKSGREIWHVKYPNGYSVVTRPVTGHGLVFVSSGWDRPALLAIRPDGAGDVTRTHVEWKLTRGAPLSTSPLLVGDELYLVSDAGNARCVDARTGKLHWSERLRGKFSASPIHAAGRIYFQDERGTTTVIKPDKKFTRLARNRVSGRTLASLTPVEGALLLRTDKRLMRIESE